VKAADGTEESAGILELFTIPLHEQPVERQAVGVGVVRLADQPGIVVGDRAEGADVDHLISAVRAGGGGHEVLQHREAGVWRRQEAVAAHRLRNQQFGVHEDVGPEIRLVEDHADRDRLEPVAVQVFRVPAEPVRVDGKRGRESLLHCFRIQALRERGRDRRGIVEHEGVRRIGRHLAREMTLAVIDVDQPALRRRELLEAGRHGPDQAVERTAAFGTCRVAVVASGGMPARNAPAIRSALIDKRRIPRAAMTDQKLRRSFLSPVVTVNCTGVSYGSRAPRSFRDRAACR